MPGHDFSRSYGTIGPSPPPPPPRRRPPPPPPARRADDPPAKSSRPSRKRGDATARRVTRLSRFIYRIVPFLYLLYLLVSCYVLHVYFKREHDAFHTWVDTLYFVSVTVVTIGYGDVYPSTRLGKAYVVVFILLGACLGSVILGFIAEWVLSVQERAARRVAQFRDDLVARDVADIRDRVANGAGPAGGRTRSASAAEAGRGGEGAEGLEEEEDTRGEDERDAYSDAKEAEGTDDSGRIPRDDDKGGASTTKALLVVLFFTTFGAACMMHIEGWHVVDAFYWAVVTVTTVGYGDVVPESQHGRLFVAGYAVFAVATVAWAISTIAESYIHASMREHAEDELSRARITPEYLVEVGGSKGYVTEADFLKAVLVNLGKCDAADIRRIEARFAELDANGDRTLSIEDLMGDMDQLAADLARVIKKGANANGGGRDGRDGGGR